LAQLCVAAGSPTILVDSSGQPTIAGTCRIAVRKSAGIAAALSLLPSAQKLVIELADARIENVGTPIRSGKITRDE
jgi:fructoselysine-6-P-deglycase FrlB-like protein